MFGRYNAKKQLSTVINFLAFQELTAAGARGCGGPSTLGLCVGISEVDGWGGRR
jgi:hypothetical protein